jgi:PBSX family phage terminase large subunit
LTSPAADDLKPEHRPYRPVGKALDLLHYKGTEVVMSGPAGTGKSRAGLEKLHLCAEKYAGMRGLIVRKTRESLTEAALVTWEQHVVPAGHPILAAGGQRRMRQAYQYPNGSSIVVGGLDKAQKVMSTEYDTIYVQEGIELVVEDWESLTTRLRNGKMPYQQLLADTNPDSPTHWLKRRCDAGKTLLLESRHEDNPILFDPDRREWTARGKAYIAMLEGLTGPRLQRLRYGRWVQAEGVVYEGWDAAVHLVNRFDLRPEWDRFLAIDFGYTNPFVCQWWARDPDGRLYRYREIYHTRRLVEDHARQIKALSVGEPAPLAIICDTDAEDRATLEKYLGQSTVAAAKTVTDGIQAVAERLRPAGDGKPRLFFLRDSLVERDPCLTDAKKPCCTEEEFDSYCWNQKEKRRKDDEPVKLNNHGQDAMRYLVMHADGCVRWEPYGAEPVNDFDVPADVWADYDGNEDRDQ